MNRVRVRVLTALFLVAAGPTAGAAEPGTPEVPAAVRAIQGCWRGDGEVMGKAVRATLTGRPIAENAMHLVETTAVAAADARDRYAAHLLFAGAKTAPGGREGVWSFWADSFGAGFTAPGEGQAEADGFEVRYRYPDAVFVNRWALHGGELSWTIVARSGAGDRQEPFATYRLRPVACAAD